MATPKTNTAYDFSVALIDIATGDFKASPTIVVGDFQVSIDGAAYANLTTLPTVTPGGSITVKIDLSADEMNGDKILVQGIDQSDDEWEDILIFIDIPEDVLKTQIDGTVTVEESLRLQNSAAGGKVIQGSGTVQLRDLADTKDRVDAVTDNEGFRSSVTRDLA